MDSWMACGGHRSMAAPAVASTRGLRVVDENAHRGTPAGERTSSKTRQLSRARVEAAVVGEMVAGRIHQHRARGGARPAITAAEQVQRERGSVCYEIPTIDLIEIFDTDFGGIRPWSRFAWRGGLREPFRARREPGGSYGQLAGKRSSNTPAVGGHHRG